MWISKKFVLQNIVDVPVPKHHLFLSLCGIEIPPNAVLLQMSNED